MEIVASWTKNLCIDISQGHLSNHVDDIKAEDTEQVSKHLSSWSVLDIGTGNGLLLQELAKQGYTFVVCPYFGFMCILIEIYRQSGIISYLIIHKQSSSHFLKLILLNFLGFCWGLAILECSRWILTCSVLGLQFFVLFIASVLCM